MSRYSYTQSEYDRLGSAGMAERDRCSKTYVHAKLREAGINMRKAGGQSVTGIWLCRHIVPHVSRECDIPIGELLSRARNQNVIRARWVAWMVARRGGASMPVIAKYFGMDHTTILHGLRQSAMLMQTSPLFRERVERVVAIMQARKG